MGYIYTIEYFSANKNNKFMKFSNSYVGGIGEYQSE